MKAQNAGRRCGAWAHASMCLNVFYNDVMSSVRRRLRVCSSSISPRALTLGEKSAAPTIRDQAYINVSVVIIGHYVSFVDTRIESQVPKRCKEERVDF